jgi:hypothetical protein
MLVAAPIPLGRRAKGASVLPRASFFGGGEYPVSILFEGKIQTARPALIKRRPLGLEVVPNARVRDDFQAQRLRKSWGGSNLAGRNIANTALRLCVHEADLC